MLKSTKCRSCPRDCGVTRIDDDLGFCAAPRDMIVARSALHFWEEPPISGIAGSGTIFFAFCSLRCAYCQNRKISHCDVGKRMSVDDLAGAMLRLENEGAMNINLVTPTHYSVSVRKAISVARKAGLSLPVVWNTSGYETVGNIQSNDGFVDVYLTDFKYLDPLLSYELSNAKDYPEVATHALDAMVDLLPTLQFDDLNGEERLSKGVVVRHLLLPGHVEESKAVLRFLHERYGDKIKLSIMSQYTPTLVTDASNGDEQAVGFLNKHPEFARSVSADEYEELLCFADDLGIEDYWWQDGDVASESFIPDFSEGLS